MNITYYNLKERSYGRHCTNFISKQGQAPSLQVAYFFKVFRVRICSTSAYEFDFNPLLRNAVKWSDTL